MPFCANQLENTSPVALGAIYHHLKIARQNGWWKYRLSCFNVKTNCFILRWKLFYLGYISGGRGLKTQSFVQKLQPFNIEHWQNFPGQSIFLLAGLCSNFLHSQYIKYCTKILSTISCIAQCCISSCRWNEGNASWSQFSAFAIFGI